MTAVEIQKDREFHSSFLSAKEAQAHEQAEAAEKAFNEYETKLENETKEQSTEPGASSSTSSSSLESDGVTTGRDLKPLEGTCWMKTKVLQYLSTTPAATQTADSVARFIVESKALLKDRAGDNKTKEEDTRLTVCELLQLVNLRPASLVEIHRSIEECEERLSEDDTLALLDLIDRTLPPRPGQQIETAAEGGDQQQTEPMQM